MAIDIKKSHKMFKFEEMVLKPRMFELGFKRKNGYWVKPINDELMANVSFGVAHFGVRGYSIVTPDIGIGNHEMNKIINQLLGKKNQYQPNMSFSLWLLDKSKTMRTLWEFMDGNDNSALLDEMFSNIMKYGTEFWTKMTDPDNFYESCLRLGSRTDIPVLYYMRGEKEKCLQYFEDYIRQHTKYKTDEEILESVGGTKENTIIIRPHEGLRMTAEQFEELANSLPDGGRIISPESGHIDAWYLKFIENYKKL